jgi:hypothetical protein
MSAKLGVSHKREKYYRSTETRFTLSGGRKLWVKARRLKFVALIARGTRRELKNVVANQMKACHLEDRVIDGRIILR